MARGKPEPRRGKGLLPWRSRQKPGAIMKPKTFEEIKREAMRRYGISEERAEKVAGKAYWQAAKAKAKKAGVKGKGISKKAYQRLG